MAEDSWDLETDFLVAGSGAAGLSAAITAKLNGLDVVIVESEDRWGGTTCISGGGLWLPNNPLMHRDGVQDSIDEALAYMDAVIGDVGPHTSRERKRAFLVAIPNFITMMSEAGIKWVRSKDYPDYYPDLPGGKVGRGLEVKPFNMRKLKGYQRLSRMGEGIPAPVKTDDVWLLERSWSTLTGLFRGASVVFRILGNLIIGRQSRGMGPGLAGSLMHVARKLGIPVWLSAPIVEVSNGESGIEGAVVERAGKRLRIRARRGVMLAAGGFARNAEWRKRYQGVAGWTAAPAGQNGTGIEVGARAGGALAMMEDSWWGAGVLQGPGQNGFILGERSFPHSIVVDQEGNRYLNESESYIDFGHHMLERNRTVPAIPSWLVTDHRHTRRYLNTYTLTGKKYMIQAGELVEAETLEELARKMGTDTSVFLETVQRFNESCRAGVDRSFGRGRTAYDRYYSDPTVKPNPNLGTIEKGPFRATKLYPGDLGTKGGLVTDEHARVLREDGAAIQGLYAAGNNTASVMGHTYPGPGSTIAPAAIFGYLGALHAARRRPKEDTSATRPPAKPTTTA